MAEKLEKQQAASLEDIQDLVDTVIEDYEKGRDIDKMTVYSQPDQDAIRLIVSKLLRILFPGYYRDKVFKSYNLTSNLTVLIEDVIYNLNKQIAIVLSYQREREDPEAYVCQPLVDKEAAEITMRFMKEIPKIREYLDTDLEATLQGDPAALNKDEIVLSYPGLQAIAINRIAHELFLLEVPLIPRMMTEYAHSITGIDIHPGASIGKYFFIDHGTGIVVGSSTIIGEHVKVYQGVTLGALSTSGGQSLRGTKRHPTIEDNVTIYSGASILGGDTVIGRDSVIGSNAFITSSIPAGTRVTIKNQELSYKTGKGFSAQDMDPDENWFYVI